MGTAIDRLTIEGYKSIRSLKDFGLNRLNILIGSNGAGKTNFINFFRLLHEMVEERLQLAVSKEEFANNFWKLVTFFRPHAQVIIQDPLILLLILLRGL